MRSRRATRVGIRRPGDSCDVDVVHINAVTAARRALPTSVRLRRVADLLGLLSNTTRLKILVALYAADGDPDNDLCVCDIAVVAGVSKSMASHQLRLLRVAGLVQPERRGKLTFYHLVRGAPKALLGDALDLVLTQDRLSRTG